jgi:transposase
LTNQILAFTIPNIIVNENGMYTTMASIQSRISGGHKYWYIVESRRVNGKPRPIPLAYLGKPEDLLKRLQKGIGKNLKCKSYSHGAIAALIRIIEDIGVIDIINKHVSEKKKKKQIRDGLTVGGSLTLRAIEKVCHPCSNREFYSWAKSTSLEYILRISCAKLDSQHFWDQMNVLSVEEIPKIEEEIVKVVIEKEKIPLDTLLLDATNFFTFIDTTNDRCSIAQRGKNKQGRKNLRQVGILLVVSRKDIIPLFHETYTGNKADSKVFASAIEKITDRLCAIVSDLEDLTIIFDRGNNSKSNLSEEILKLHYVGALSPSQHKKLMNKAIEYISKHKDDESKACYRVKQELWGETRTLIVYRSQELYKGQLRGIKKDIEKRFKKFEELNNRLSNLRCKKLKRNEIIEQIKNIVKGQFVQDIITWNLPRKRKRYRVEYGIDDNKFEELEKSRLGYRILMTDRHKWTNEEIVAAYHSQSKVEYAFRNIKNPYHGSIRPQFHWTDQKIRVHVFTCVLGFLLESVIYFRAQKNGYRQTNYDNLFDKLNNIRLATLVEKNGKRGRMKVFYQLEETDYEDEILLDALRIKDIHINRPKLQGLVVYN